MKNGGMIRRNPGESRRLLPIETVNDAVTRAWQKVAANQPLTVLPTFSAAPQSEYYGSIVLSDGQVLHRSSAQNVFRVFTDPITDEPFTLSCHEFIFHLAAPDDPTKAWHLELLYPNDDRIRSAMTTMSPLDPPVGSDVGFPVHATSHAPPMVPLSERLHVSLRCFQRLLSANKYQLPSDIVQAGVPLDKDFVRRFTNDNLADSAGESCAIAPPNDGMDETRTARPSEAPFPIRGRNNLPGVPLGLELSADRLDDSIRRRAKRALKLDDDLFGEGSDSTDSLPDLEGVAPAKPDLCRICSEPHKSSQYCPLLQPKPRFTTDESKLKKIINEPLPFSAEMRRVLDVAVGPFLDEWLQPGYNEPLTFRALMDTAREARVAFEEFTNASLLRRAAADEGYQQRFQQDFRHELNTQDLELRAQRRKEEEQVVAWMQEEADEAELELARQLDGRLAARSLGSRIAKNLEERHSRTAVDEHVDNTTSFLLTNAARSILPTSAARLTLPSHHVRSPTHSHLAHLAPPQFDPRHGSVVTRDSWSSSESDSSDDSSYEEVEIPPYAAHQAPFIASPEDPQGWMTAGPLEWTTTTTVNPQDWSPAVSEWSVIEGFYEPVEWIIDEAVRRVLRSAPAASPAISPPSTLNTSSSDAVSTPGSLSRSSSPDAHSDMEFEDVETAHLYEALFYWAADGAEHQEGHSRHEDRECGEPAREALKALHGPLSMFVDYTAMAADGVQSLQYLAPFPDHLIPLPPSPTFADYGHPSSSLDHSLPSRSATPAPESTPISLGDVKEQPFPEEGGESSAPPFIITTDASVFSQRGVFDTPSNKREGPEGEDSGFPQEGMRKKFRKFDGEYLRKAITENEAYKAAGLTDHDTICLFSGVRLGILETARRVEDLVWHRFDITEVRVLYEEIERICADKLSTVAQRSFPARFARHSLLYDIEAAKIQTLAHILQRNGREHLADLLHEVLCIHIRNEYAVSRLLNAGYLEDCYPELATNYWDLLGAPAPNDEWTHVQRESPEASPDREMSLDDYTLEYPPSDYDSDEGSGYGSSAPDYTSVGIQTYLHHVPLDLAGHDVPVASASTPAEGILDATSDPVEDGSGGGASLGNSSGNGASPNQDVLNSFPAQFLFEILLGLLPILTQRFPAVWTTKAGVHTSGGFPIWPGRCLVIVYSYAITTILDLLTREMSEHWSRSLSVPQSLALFQDTPVSPASIEPDSEMVGGCYEMRRLANKDLQQDWAELEEDDEYIFYPLQLHDEFGGEHQAFTMYHRTPNGSILGEQAEYEDIGRRVDDENDPGQDKHEEDSQDETKNDEEGVYTMYKRVDKKIKPVSTTFSPDYEVTRNIPQDPLLTLPELTPNPPPFQSTTRLDSAPNRGATFLEAGNTQKDVLKVFYDPVFQLPPSTGLKSRCRRRENELRMEENTDYRIRTGDLARTQ
ncbi:hypothetical protein C8R46DRAFT_1051393 [Mycena filopes]|nr:hypothetical protein C8R46DRAFT_1051393 [Mycena filopes]